MIELPRSDEPQLSVIVIGFRRADTLERCLESLALQESRHPFDVMLVLNGPAADVRELVDQRVVGAVVRPLPVNTGFAAGCNYGAAATVAPFIALLNDDAEVEPGWVDALLEAMSEHPEAAMVGSLVTFPDGRVQDAGGWFLPDGMPEVEGRGADPDEPIARQGREVGYATASAVAIRRQAWDAVGGMDEAFFPAYFEDADLCLRLRAAGWTIRFEPAAVVRHVESASTDVPVREAAWALNKERFLARWGPGVPPPSPSTGLHQDLEDPAVQAGYLQRLADLADTTVALLAKRLERVQAESADLRLQLGKERDHTAWLQERLDEEQARLARLQSRLPVRVLQRLDRVVARPSTPSSPTPESGAAP